MRESSRAGDLQTKDEAVLRKYLLGDMSPEEQEEIELWLMSHEDAYCLLEAAEDDLIDDSLAGRLQRHEIHKFNTYFLTASERQQKLRFSRSFRKYFDALDRVGPVESFWTRLLDNLRYRPVVGYVLASLL